MKPSEILHDARKLIVDPSNWAKIGRINPSEGRYCALLAVTFTTARRGCGNAVDRAARAYLLAEILDKHAYRHRFGSESRRVSLFNDHPDTTHADVLRLFDRAIVVAETDEADRQAEEQLYYDY